MPRPHKSEVTQTSCLSPAWKGPCWCCVFLHCDLGVVVGMGTPKLCQLRAESFPPLFPEHYHQGKQLTHGVRVQGPQVTPLLMASLRCPSETLLHDTARGGSVRIDRGLCQKPQVKAGARDPVRWAAPSHQQPPAGSNPLSL